MGPDPLEPYKFNFVKMNDYFIFRNHVCIVF